MSPHATQQIRRVPVERNSIAVSWAGQIVFGGILLCLAISVPVSAEVLDHLNLGAAESEQAHGLTSEGSEIPAMPKPPATDTYIATVEASAGTAPESTLVKPGEWGVGREGEWIQYHLNRPTMLDRVAVAWGRTQPFLFEIYASPDGKDWKKVFRNRPALLLPAQKMLVKWHNLCWPALSRSAYKVTRSRAVIAIKLPNHRVGTLTLA